MRRLCLLAATLLVACDSPPALRFLVDGQPVASHDAGTVTLTRTEELVLTVENRSDGAVQLFARELRGELHGEAFAIASDECGRSLAAGERCAVHVRLDPIAEAHHAASLAIRYDDGERGREVAVRVSVRGRLDCAVSAALTTGRDGGTTAARADNASQADKGTADGRALTYDDGYADAYDTGYRRGYDAGYADGAYDAAYRESYDEGVLAGRNDARACADGDAAGATDGHEDGVATATTDGHAAGKHDGYADGYARGERDAKKECTLPARDEPRSSMAPDDPALVTACWKRGYAQTIDAQAYATAYRESAAKNTAYRDGRAAGDAAGYNVGAAAGDARAAADGDEVGYTNGYRAGADARFGQCYDARYPSGYQSGYEAAYPTAYDSGYDDGFDGGYDAAYRAICG